jgi:hypothetical protein
LMREINAMTADQKKNYIIKGEKKWSLLTHTIKTISRKM